MAHSCEIAVRGFHCDGYGHVNNARYLEFLEEARWDALTKTDILASFEQLGLQFFIVNIDISFRKPIGAGDLINVQTSVKEFGRMSITFLQIIVKNGELTTEALVKFVLFDTSANRGVSLTPELIQLFSSFKDA